MLPTPALGAWSSVFVDERNLKVHIGSLRRALNDTLPQPTYIATVARHGYQFVGRVRSERASVVDFSTDSENQPVLCSLPPLVPLIGDSALVPHLVATTLGVRGDPTDLLSAVAGSRTAATAGSFLISAPTLL